MDNKKRSLKTIIIIIAALEILVLIVSGGLNKGLEFGFDSGKFKIQLIEKPYNLQEKITEDFQPDLYLQEEILHAKSEGKELHGEIYGSKALYNVVSSVFGKDMFGNDNTFNAFKLIRILLIVNLVVLLLIWATRRKMGDKPSKLQILFEMLYSFFEEFVRDTLGKKNLHFTPYIVIWICNMIGMIPIPGFMEPTRNLNVPLALGIIAMVVVHSKAIKEKGLWKHSESYINPIKNPLFILDLVGEISKVVSISFRLFGNILGGAIIILVVSSLVKFFLFPVGLNLFFGIFVGSIQAFVFTMLALTYIGVEIGE